MVALPAEVRSGAVAPAGWRCSDSARLRDWSPAARQPARRPARRQRCGGSSSSFHSPSLDAGREAILEADLETQALGGHRLERDLVVPILLDAPGPGSLHRLPRIAVLVEDAPG